MRKKSASGDALFSFGYSILSMESHTAKLSPDLSALRQKIAELVAQNALPMVQQAIDAVREEGQYQAMKYLFEMIGLYPATAQDDSGVQESLAQILLDQLGLSDSSAKNP